MLLLMLLCVGLHHDSVVVGYHGDGSVSQDDVIRFVLSMQSKAGPTSADRARLRHYQQLPTLMFAEGKDPNSINDNDDIDKTVYGVGFR